MRERLLLVRGELVDAASTPSIAELCRMYGSGPVAPVEVAGQTLSRFERLDPKLNSCLTVSAERALEHAARIALVTVRQNA